MAKGLGLHMKGYFGKARERYVLDYVKSELIKEYGREQVLRGGFKVYTTINLKYQKYARDTMSANLAGIGPSSAIVTIDPEERRHPHDGVDADRTGAARASRPSTSPPRATASPARRSRSWC